MKWESISQNKKNLICCVKQTWFLIPINYPYRFGVCNNILWLLCLVWICMLVDVLRYLKVRVICLAVKKLTFILLAIIFYPFILFDIYIWAVLFYLTFGHLCIRSVRISDSIRGRVAKQQGITRSRIPGHSCTDFGQKWASTSYLDSES